MLSLLIGWGIVKVFTKVFSLDKPGKKNAKPGEITDKDVPIAEQNGPIPVLFGNRIISGPNVVWYGDVYVKPIRKSASGGKK